MRIAQFKIRTVNANAAFLSKQALDNLDSLNHALALRGGLDTKHVRIAGQCAGAAAEHHTAVGQVVEQSEAVGDIEGMMIRNAHYARTEHNPLGAGGCYRHKDSRRRNNFPAGRTTLAD